MKDTKEGQQASAVSLERGQRSVVLEEAPQRQRPSIARALVILLMERQGFVAAAGLPGLCPACSVLEKSHSQPWIKEISANHTL